MKNDLLILGAALAGFTVFVIVQILFVRSGPEKILKGLRNDFLCSAVVTGALSAAALKSAGFSWMLGSALIAVAVYALICFLYILCVFGPYESSIRMRLLRELYRSPERSLTLPELLSRYNAAMILERRLDRMLVSGDVRFDGGTYRLGRAFNLFFFKNKVCTYLKKYHCNLPYGG